MRTVQSKTTTNVGNEQKVVVKTTTYMKVGDLIGTAKTAYDLGKVLRRKAPTIKKTLKQYGVDYINNMLTPLIALITGMDIYKKIMSVIEIATPIAKTIARATTVFPHGGNAADIASIILSTVTKIIVQLATIFLLKMKEMIWNFEFKIREISNQYVVEQIAMATRNTVDLCNNIVNLAVSNLPSNIDMNINGLDLSIIPLDFGLVVAPDGTAIMYSDINEGIKYLENGEWHSTNFTDGSFQPCKTMWNGVMFAFSYEGTTFNSKQYGVIYSLNNGRYWNYLNPDDKNYYVYDAAIFGDNINFSQYTDVLTRGGIKYSKRQYEILPVLNDNFSSEYVYMVDGDNSNFYTYNGSEMQLAERYMISTKCNAIIKPQRIISCSMTYDNGVFTAGVFEDELTQDGQKVEDLMNHDIKYYGDTSCIMTENSWYDIIEVNSSISEVIQQYYKCFKIAEESRIVVDVNAVDFKKYLNGVLVNG